MGRCYEAGLESHNTYSIVTRDDAHDAPVLPLKWVYANKTDESGEITQRKARICVRGDLQKGLDFHAETLLVGQCLLWLSWVRSYTPLWLRSVLAA
jgi:hypothetical protein